MIYYLLVNLAVVVPCVVATGCTTSTEISVRVTDAGTGQLLRQGYVMSKDGKRAMSWG